MSWETADRIGSQVTALIEAELAKPDPKPMECCAALLLALADLLETAPIPSMPLSLRFVKSAIEICLQDYLQSHPRQQTH